MTLQELQSLDVPASYASLMDALRGTPHTLKLAYIPSVVPAELECELHPETVRPDGEIELKLLSYEETFTPLETSLLCCWKEYFHRWMKGHASSHLNADTLSEIGWYWMGTYFESDAIAHDLSCPKTRAFPYDYIVFRIYLQPTNKKEA